MNTNTNLIALQTILIKEVNRILRIWGQTLVPPAITMTLYFLIFGNLIGERIGEMGGHRYIDYIVPGLVMMSVITNAYGNVVSSFFGSKFGRYVEELLVSPTPPWVILAGYVGGGVFRGLLVGLIVTAVSLLFTRLSIAHPFIMLATLLLSAVIFALAGFINAVYAKKFDGHIDRADLHSHPADLSGWCVLFGFTLAALVEHAVPLQSHPVHGQCLPLRHSGSFGWCRCLWHLP